MFEITGNNFRKLIKDGYVIKKPNAIHSRARVNKRLDAKRKGRHTVLFNLYNKILLICSIYLSLVKSGHW